MQVTEVANSVFALRLFERSVCAGYVGWLKSNGSWSEAQVLAEADDGSAVSVSRHEVRAASLSVSPTDSEIYQDFAEKMSSTVMPLIKYLWRADFTQHSELQIVRYGAGGHYAAHTDGGFFMKERYFTLLCYLNEDFSGGGTNFPSLGFTARAASGNAIIFPSRYVHCAEPVLDGEKFVMVSWVLGPVAVEWI